MRQQYEHRVRQVLDYIHDNPAGDLSLDALCEIACMSRFHWHRVFFAMTGETCAQAVRRIRAYRSACLLVQTNLPIDCIAKRTGYGSERSFTRNFREFFNATPKAFRTSAAPPAALEYTLNDGAIPMYNVELRQQPAYRLASLPHQGSYFEIGKVFDQLSTIATARNLWGSVQGMVGVYYDDPESKPEAELQSRAGFVLKEGTAIPDDLQELILPAGKAAVLHHEGPYAELRDAYIHLYGSWLPDSGHEPAETPPYEIYLNSPQDTPADKLQTDICLIIR